MLIMEILGMNKERKTTKKDNLKFFKEKGSESDDYFFQNMIFLSTFINSHCF